MKRMIRISIVALFMGASYLANPEPKIIQAIEAVEETSGENIDNLILSKIEAYLDDYLEEFPADDVDKEKPNLKEYMFKKLETDDFTKEEISQIFEILAENRLEALHILMKIYLEEDPFLSKKGLLLKVPVDSYSQKQVNEVLESLAIDWQEQAVKASEEYINTESEFEGKADVIISPKSLQDFLIAEKEFTVEEALYGIEKSGINWSEQAVKQAKYYLATDAYSKKELIKQLVNDGFTKEEAEYGVDQIEVDWINQAFKKAESYLAHSPLQSKEGLQNYLQQEGFSKAEIDDVISEIFDEEATDDAETEDEIPTIKTPEITTPKRPIIIKPIEYEPSRIDISVSVPTSKPVDYEKTSSSDLRTPKTKKSQSPTTKMAPAETEEIEELETTNLLDHPIFLPVIVVLVVGNLYLFQKS